MKKAIINISWEETIETGVVYIDLDGGFFPKYNWFDCPLGVVEMWLLSVWEFISKNYMLPCELFFMDGPFSVILTANEQGVINLHKNEMSQDHEVEIVDFSSFVDSLLQCAKRISIYLHNQNTYSTLMRAQNIDRLRKRIMRKMYTRSTD